jgi:chromosome segregation ATPase
MRSSPNHLIFVGLIAIAGAMPLSAQTTRQGSGNNAQLMQQMQQLATEGTRLQAENARMKRELDEARKERDALKGEKDSSEKRLRNTEAAAMRASGDRRQIETEMAQSRERMNELVTKFRETVATLREIESDRAGIQQQLQVRTQDLRGCVDRNAQLYTMNTEILDRLDNQGFWSSMARAEPFTRIKRNQLENLADDYRARAEEARLESTPPAAQNITAPTP